MKRLCICALFTLLACCTATLPLRTSGLFLSEGDTTAAAVCDFGDAANEDVASTADSIRHVSGNVAVYVIRDADGRVTMLTIWVSHEALHEWQGHFARPVKEFEVLFAAMK